MDKLEKNLKAILFRSDCPSKMDLGEYEMGLLSSQRRDELASHLNECPQCQVDLVQMQHFMTLPAIGIETMRTRAEQRSPLLERIKVIVVDLLTPPAGIQGSLALQPVMRGAESETRTKVIQADAYIVALSAQDNKAPRPNGQIIGDITPLADDDESFQNWTADLWRSGQLLASTPVADDSHFIFEDVQFEEQPHDLILSGPTVEIHLQNLQMA